MATGPLIIQKYGGTSLSSPDRIRAIAGRIAERASGETRFIVTVSAMGQSTDDLMRLAYEITPDPPQRELDMLLTVGERVSMALLSMALNAAGCPAISFTGSQSGIVTTVSHTRARIEEIRADRIKTELDKDKVVIVAGFQGVSREKEITTLGRGGSDTTAVAMAAALAASQCEIYSDYPGVCTADPRWIAAAKTIPAITYDEMVELSTHGAQVLHYRAAEIARRDRVPLRLLSTFEEVSGTTVSDDASGDSARPTSVTCNPRVAVVRVRARDGKGIERLRAVASRLEIPVSSYYEVETTPEEISLVVHGEDSGELENAIRSIGNDYSLTSRDDRGTVSVVGGRFARSDGAAAGIEQTLSEAGIKVDASTVTPLSISSMVPRKDCRAAVEALHAALFVGANA